MIAGSHQRAGRRWARVPRHGPMPVSPTQPSSGTHDIPRAEDLMLNAPALGVSPKPPPSPLPVPVETRNAGTGPARVPSVGWLPAARPTVVCW